MAYTPNQPPCALVILDGFGKRSSKEGNAVALAKMPHFNSYIMHYPHLFLEASGNSVGLLPGFIGNSEVGHLTLGAGRIVPSILKEFHDAISDGSLNFHPIIHKRFSTLTSPGRLHFIGLLSDGGVHSHEEHLHALLKQAAQYPIADIFVHAFLDGRDVAPQSAATYLQKLDACFKKIGTGALASIQGRFYAMDRDKNWERTEKAYQVITGALPATSKKWPAVIGDYYAQNITDEFIPPTLLLDNGFIKEGDGVLFFNFRPDRARQLTELFLNPHFTQGEQTITRDKLAFFITTTRYKDEFKYWKNDILFENATLRTTLLDELSSQTNGQLTTFIIAETEKYAHVTYFFRGMRDIQRPNETRCLIPSMKLKNYIDNPEMSALEITDHILDSLKNHPADFYLINYANADMVGHSGNLQATIKACEILDEQLGKLYEEFVMQRNGTLFITSDHGNAEYKIDPTTHQPHTAHTCNPVPFIAINKKLFGHSYKQQKELGLYNVAPTLLHHFNLNIPKEMSAQLDIQKKDI